MTIRQADPFDLPSLFLNRSRCVGLDLMDELAFGHPLQLHRVIRRTIPFDGQFTLVDSFSTPNYLGVTFSPNNSTARLSFLLSTRDSSESSLDLLIEEACHIVANLGAFHLLADSFSGKINNRTVKSLGFTVLSPRLIFEIKLLQQPATSLCWKGLLGPHAQMAKLVYDQLTPPNIVSVMPFNTTSDQWWGCEGKTIFAKVSNGPAGVVIMPLVQTGTNDVEIAFVSLVQQVSQGNKRPVYFILWPYMDWIAPILEKIGGSILIEDKVLVKNLAKKIRVHEEVVTRSTNGIRVQTSHFKQNDKGSV